MKQLRQEIACVEMTARVEGRAVTELGPPDESVMAHAAALERSVIALVTGQTEPSPGVRDSEDAEVELTTTTMRLRVSEETGRFWRALERAYAGLWLPGSFVAFLVRAVMKAWTGAVPKQLAYGDVYLRDRWRCASPICERRDVTPHHLNSGRGAAAKSGGTY